MQSVQQDNDKCFANCRLNVYASRVVSAEPSGPTLRYSRNRIDAYDYVDAPPNIRSKHIRLFIAFMASYRSGNCKLGIPLTSGLRPDSSYRHRPYCRVSLFRSIGHVSPYIYHERLWVCLVYLATLATLFYDMLLFLCFKSLNKYSFHFLFFLFFFTEHKKLITSARVATYYTVKFQQSESNCFKNILSKKRLYYFSIFFL